MFGNVCQSVQSYTKSDLEIDYFDKAIEQRQEEATTRLQIYVTGCSRKCEIVKLFFFRKLKFD